MVTYKELDKVPNYSTEELFDIHTTFEAGLFEVDEGNKNVCMFLRPGCNDDEAYYCRESDADYAKLGIMSGKLHKVPYIHFISTKEIAEELCTYLNYIEDRYSFQGTLSSLICEEEYSKYGVFMITLRLASEWFRSPTMYQLLNLVVRYVVQAHCGMRENLVDLSKLDTSNEDIFHVFSYEGYMKRAIETGYVGAFYKKLTLTSDFILPNREVLFSGSMKEEWSADPTETEYGKTDVYDMFSFSGTASFYNSMVGVLYGGTRSNWYFKHITKIGIITHLLRAYLDNNPGKKEELLIGE